MKDREIFCLNNISRVGTGKFRRGYTLTDHIDNAAAVLVRSADMHELQLPSTLRAIGRAGAGVNNIPLESCAEQGIVVFNTPGANANAVKELVLAGLMAASRDFVGGNVWVRENAGDPDIKRTAEKAKKNFAGVEIKGKTLGVIGLGAIGVLVANAAAALGMEVYGYDPYLSVNSAWNLSHKVRHAALTDEIYEKCDYITLHVPAADGTKGMINRESIHRMKDGVRILNFARDILVNDEDMREALSRGKVKAYVTDFPNTAVANMPGAIVLPHLGASTEEAEDNCAVMAVEEIQDYLDNGNIRNSVNFPDVDAGICQTEGRLAILHRNIPNMLSRITSALGEANINIGNMQNRSRGAYAYTLTDIDSPLNEEGFRNLQRIEGILRVRKVK
ncbi:phosphoglycerate dehydrogenase [Oribacterium sp. oral taxon 102]|uniref:phosphoglycerate dehydrogenase n=1 Tax=Oribacterium sp. oral taxon 102 TaxID=671214 RepID=UPI0015BC6842|nr:phosphoglycerate dehydrogenase [Oribacterium sp. oral taxon 102]NWO22016.1 phosphoglycerate dehydrogenase [Oribacterium sp. oral taxon 102]